MTKPLSLTAKRLGINLALLATLAPLGHGQVKGQTYVGTSSLSSQSDREIIRRQEDVLIARQFIAEGDLAWEKGDYEIAYQSYLNALDLLGPGAATASEQSETLGKFSDVGIDYANELINNGRYSDAEAVAKTILLERYNPTYRPAVALLSKLEQPDYYNKTVTPQFAADRDEVAQLLIEAEGFFTTGRYDLAKKRYTTVLGIDRYNVAAQKGIERVENAKGDYYENAYNETRSRMLWEVTERWELPRKKFQGGKDTIRDTTLSEAARNEQITAKLNRIIIPQLDLRDTTIREAVEYLRQLSQQLDTLEPDPAKRGVNIFLKVPSGSNVVSTDGLLGVPGEDEPVAAAPTATEDTTVTLALNSVPLYEALRYLADLAGLKIKIDSVAVSIVPLTEVTEELVTKEYRVPPTFIPSQAGTSETASISSFTFNSDTTPEERIRGRQNAQTYLESQSVPFPPGSSANYIAAGSRLIVRNTQDNIDLIDVLVDITVGQAPTQVEVEAKFVEINQNNLKELGFDYALGPLQIGGTNSPIYGAGGSPGLNSAAFPFNSPGGGVIGQNNVTSGLRSGQGAGGSSAISVNGIDGLLSGVPAGVAPAIFGLSGVFTNPQFQFVIRALNQKKGVDLMSAPSVTTKSGSKAVINIVREFRYPTEFDPPQIPQSTGAAENENITSGFLTSGIVTPTTPTAFETRNTGVTLDVTPVVGPDNYTIDLELSPEVVDFEGFVNYGTPIRGIDPGNLANFFTPSVIDITDNVINQPIFNTRKVTTNVTIWDGMTVALGGLIREDVQKVEDKVPLLGDIPLVGRLFRSDVDQKIKKNLIIFVTARLMDAEGKPVRSGEEEEEIVELLGVPESVPPPVYQIKGGYK